MTDTHTSIRDAKKIGEAVSLVRGLQEVSTMPIVAYGRNTMSGTYTKKLADIEAASGLDREGALRVLLVTAPSFGGDMEKLVKRLVEEADQDRGSMGQSLGIIFHMVVTDRSRAALNKAGEARRNDDMGPMQKETILVEQSLVRAIGKADLVIDRCKAVLNEAVSDGERVVGALKVTQSGKVTKGINGGGSNDEERARIALLSPYAGAEVDEVILGYANDICDRVEVYRNQLADALASMPNARDPFAEGTVEAGTEAESDPDAESDTEAESD